MGSRIHIYALPGLPIQLDDLMPQPLLARFSGSLTAQGHSVLIFDEGSIERLETACPPGLGDALSHHMNHAERSFEAWKSALSPKERYLRRAHAGFRENRIAQVLAAETTSRPRMALIQIHNAKDVSDARMLARRLKERDENLIVAVAGDFVDQYARWLLSGACEFDAACPGHAESIATGLARNLDNRAHWPNVPGLLFRFDGGIYEGMGMRLPIDPWFASADYHPSRYPALLDGGKIKLFTLRQTAGHAHQGHYRGGATPRARVVRECRQMRSDLEQLHRLFGVSAFHIAGGHTPAEMMLGFASECLNLPFSIRYSRDSHVHELGADVVHALRASGCDALSISLLTGSQWTLSDFYGENWTISEAETALRRVRAHGIYLHTAFTYPCPVDDYHTRAETFRIIRRNQPDGVRLRLPTLTPGSAWFQHSDEFNFVVALKKFGQWASNPPFSGNRRDEALNLPFQMTGMRQNTVSSLYNGALAELEELQIDTVSGAAAALMARVSGYEGRESEYTALVEESAQRLDLAALRDAIELFNARTTAPISTVDLFPPVPVKKVVGS